MSRHDDGLRSDYHQAMSFPETYDKKKGGEEILIGTQILFLTLLKCAVVLTKDAA